MAVVWAGEATGFDDRAPLGASSWLAPAPVGEL